MRLGPAAKVAIVGAGPSGLITAKLAIEAGFRPTVFEASADIGGQWNTDAAHSGVWPGMHTNTSRAMTAFSEFPGPADWPLHPTAEQVRDYLHDFAQRFELSDAIRLENRVTSVSFGWSVNGERYDAVVVASGRFRKPHRPVGLDGFRGDLLHAFDYPGAQAFRGQRALVYGNGISGHEIASDIAPVAPVVSAFRKPRYVLQKVVDGVPSDWQWYTYFDALQRRTLSREAFRHLLRRRVIEVAGDPAGFGAPRPDPDILTAGLSLSQDYLQQVAANKIICKPAIATIRGHDVTFSDGSRESVDAVVCATGYELDLPFLSDDVWTAIGRDLGGLYLHTLHPDLPGFAAVGQFLAQGPYFPLLELQARWIIGMWAGHVEAPDAERLRANMVNPSPALYPHNVLAAAIAAELGVAPDPRVWPDLAEALLFGPMLPSRYRLSGPGASHDAAELFLQQLASSPRSTVGPGDIEALAGMGLADVADRLHS